MILLNEITIKNFLSHEDTKLSFQEAEKLLVDGKSGSGKSTITEAIVWALYGKARSDNRNLVRRGAKKGAVSSVSLKITDGQCIFIITRSTTGAGKNTLTVTKKNEGSDRFLQIERVGIKDIQIWIEEEFLKASYELFTNSVCYPQGNENSFVDATASRRKDLLLEIVRCSTFDGLYEKARETLTSTQNGMVEGLTKIKGFEEVILKSTDIASKFEFYKTAHGLAKSQIDTIEMIEKDLEGQINNISHVSGQLSSSKKMKEILGTSLLKINTKSDDLYEEIKMHGMVDIAKARLDQKMAEGLQKDIDVLEKDLKDIYNGQQIINAHLSNRPSVFDYTKEIEEINKRLIALMKETGKCPAGDKCPFLVTVKGQIDYLVGQIEEKAAKSVSEADAFERWDKASKLLPQIGDARQKYTELEGLKLKVKDLLKAEVAIKDYESFESKLEGYKKEIADYKIEGDQIVIELMSLANIIKELETTLVKFDINKTNSDLASLRISKQGLQKELELATLNMSLATNAQYTIKDAQEGILALQNGFKESTLQVESLELLKEALSPRGVKAVVIDYIVPQLEERINNVLGKMSDFRIRLDTQKATVDEEGVKEGLFITVLNDLKEELPFASYSGGEKVKITVAISEALASLVSGVGFRIMDENIVSLDKESTEGFVTVLTKLQDNFPQLLVISHLQEVKDIFEKKITVTKINGISKIYEK